MNKVKTDIRENPITHIKPVKIYIEDLQDIERVLKELGVDEFRYKIKGAEYDSLSELINDMGDKIVRELEVKTNKPSISIHLTPNSASIYYSELSYAVDGGMQAIIRILENRRGLIYRNLLQLRCATIFSSLVSLIISIIIGVLSNMIIFPFILVVIFSFIYVIIGYYALSRYSMVIFREKTKEIGFWNRNKDQLLVNLFNQIPGFFLGILATIVATILLR